MTQSRTQSALETTLNIGSGYLLAMATQAVLYPLYGIHTSAAQDAGIAAVFTAVSLVRAYVWRRIFNRLGQRSKPAMEPFAMSDVNCPYCGKGLEICHDDGFGYAEDVRHEYECGHCGKNFVFTTSVHFYYEAEKADCLNGQPHNLKPASSAKYSGFPDHVRCEDCEYEDRGKYQPEAIRPFYEENV